MEMEIILNKENLDAAFKWAMMEAKASGFPPEEMEECRITGLDDWYNSYVSPHRSIFEGDAGNGFEMYIREYQPDKNLVKYMTVINPGGVMRREVLYRIFLRNGIFAWKQAEKELEEM